MPPRAMTTSEEVVPGSGTGEGVALATPDMSAVIVSNIKTVRILFII